MQANELSVPTNAADAISFALSNLEPFEVVPFLKDFQDGKPLEDWINSIREDRRDAQTALGDA